MDRPRDMDKPQPFGTRKSNASSMPAPSANPMPQPYPAAIPGQSMHRPMPSGSAYPTVPPNGMQTTLPQTTAPSVPMTSPDNAMGQPVYGQPYSGQSYSGQPIQAPTMPGQTIVQPGGAPINDPQAAPVNGYGTPTAPQAVPPQTAPAKSGGISGFWNWITGG